MGTAKLSCPGSGRHRLPAALFFPPSHPRTITQAPRTGPVAVATMLTTETNVCALRSHELKHVDRPVVQQCLVLTTADTRLCLKELRLKLVHADLRTPQQCVALPTALPRGSIPTLPTLAYTYPHRCWWITPPRSHNDKWCLLTTTPRGNRPTLPSLAFATSTQDAGRTALQTGPLMAPSTEEVMTTHPHVNSRPSRIHTIRGTC